MRVSWHCDATPGGDANGYLAQSSRTLAAAEGAGLVVDDRAPVAVHVVSPARFRPITGAINVLYTNWEAPDLFPVQIERIAQAALVVTISEFCAAAFRPHTAAPVEVVPLGVDRAFAPTLRERPAGPFRWLWVGAPSHRKGWDAVTGELRPGARGGVWHTFGWSPRSDVELVMKWSERHGRGGVERDGNVTYDSRQLAVEDLAALYRSAHGFLFPSFGEGFGLTLAEAMATGCPALFAHHGGVLEYGAGAPWALETELVEPHDSWDWHGGIGCRVPRVRLDSLDAQMRAVMATYPTTALAAYQRGQVIAEGFTWERAGREFVAVLERHFGAVRAASRTMTTAGAPSRATWAI